MDIPIPKHVQDNLNRLRRWANTLRQLYPDTPIYLVGSALSGSNPNPRDWDIRIIVPDEEFVIRFGNVEEWEIEGATGEWTDIRWKWADECIKRVKSGWGATGLNIDFQIYPESHTKRVYPDDLPKLRLDDVRQET